MAETKDVYEDIINLPHHVSERHPQMPMAERAAQFSPFAALTGFGAVIRETERQTDQMREMTENEREELDYKLGILCNFPGEKPCVAITYFVPDEKKRRGSLSDYSRTDEKNRFLQAGNHYEGWKSHPN